jgi:hypothetical protein
MRDDDVHEPKVSRRPPWHSTRRPFDLHLRRGSNAHT